MARMADAVGSALNHRMRKALFVPAALAGLALLGWLGYGSLTGEDIIPDTPRISGLPDTRAEWHGRVDYERLALDLAALSLRPEMAGLAVAVVEDGEIRFVRTYGFADRSSGARVTPQTLFRWASVSKTVTGTLAASLAQDNALDLNRPLSSWPNSLRLPGGAESQVSLAQLLSQQTGLTKNAYDERLEAGESPTVARTALAGAPLQCAPGSCHTYQNIAFDAASEILGQAAKTPFELAVRSRFFDALGMASASYGMVGLTASGDWARPHRGSDVRPLKENYWRVPAAAGVNSNIVDFARWMQATMGRRTDVLSADVLRLAQSPRVITPRLYSGDLARALAGASYGLGWRSFTYDGRLLVGHSGAVDGYRATMIFEPASQTGVVAMWNSNWGVPFRIPFAVFDSYYKNPDSRWLDVSDIELPRQTTTEPTQDAMP